MMTLSPDDIDPVFRKVRNLPLAFDEARKLS